jgi:hypothetical protein
VLRQSFAGRMLVLNRMDSSKDTILRFITMSFIVRFTYLMGDEKWVKCDFWLNIVKIQLLTGINNFIEGKFHSFAKNAQKAVSV